MTDSEMIDELTTLEAAATPGPWRSVKIAYPDSMAVVVRDGTRDPIFHDGIGAGIAKEADADLTESARNNLPRLLALARRTLALESALLAAAKASKSEEMFGELVSETVMPLLTEGKL